MAALLILILICSILLAITGSLSPWISGILAAASLAGLAVQSWYKRQYRLQLKSRRQDLKAVWGLAVRHLGGLPLPLDTVGNLFALQDLFVLETDHDNLTIPIADIQHILVTNAEKIYHLTDQQLCGMLEAGNSRVFSALRERIRHHDSRLRHHGFLLLAYRTPDDGANLLILATGQRPQALEKLMQLPVLAGKIKV